MVSLWNPSGFGAKIQNYFELTKLFCVEFEFFFFTALENFFLFGRKFFPPKGENEAAAMEFFFTFGLYYFNTNR